MLNINEYIEYNNGFYYIKKWDVDIIKTYLSLGCTLIGIFKPHVYFNEDIPEIKIYLVISDNKLVRTFKLTSCGIKSDSNHNYDFVLNSNDDTIPKLWIKAKMEI